MTLSNEQLRELARCGAEARIKELEAEIAAIRAEFRSGGGGVPSPFSQRARKASARKRPGMSVAQKAEVSKRMKAYWAKKRAQKAAGKRAAAKK